ncbi:MAG TPA: signal peptidase II [Acidimicrobiales bacterium]|nr:signal peptidase II [Acidimicrobiales bacterium]
MVALVVSADQLSKSLAQRALESGDVHVLGPLDLELSYNPGVAFGLGRGLSPALVVAGVMIVVAAVAMTSSLRDRTSAAAAGLVAGGAVSNLADRLIRGHGGAVIDWIHLSHWPTFNVADSCIVVGVGLLVLSGYRRPGGSLAHA